MRVVQVLHALNPLRSHKNLPDGVVAEGHLWILAVGQSVSTAQLQKAWTKCYVVLRADQVVNGQAALSYFARRGKTRGVGDGPKGGEFLSADFFVADSLLRPHAFQVSDFGKTVYLSSESSRGQHDQSRHNSECSGAR